MKREIKFRFYSGHKNSVRKMIYPEVYTSDDLIESPSWEVMQYTGLLDKNGKEIYEGDIVRSINENDKKEIGNLVVSFEELEQLVFMKNFSNEIEVLGNIYENSDLLSRSNQ